MGAGLGYAAGGAVQGFGAGQQFGENIQNDQALSALGAAARVMSGGGQPQAQQQPSTPRLGDLMGQQQTAATGIARSPMPQPPPTIQGQGAQPPVANAAPQAVPQPQQAQPQTPQGTQLQGTAQLSQQTQQPSQQQTLRPPVHPEARGEGPWTFAGLAQALRQANPNLSDRALGKALFLASPLLNQMGLQQYRGAELSLAQERNQQGWERLDLQNKREGRIAETGAARQQQTAALAQQKLAVQEAGRQLAADIQAAGFPPDEAKVKAAQEKYQKAIDEANNKFESSMQPQEDSGGDHKPGEIYTASDGKQYRFKGGDWDSKDSFEPVQ